MDLISKSRAQTPFLVALLSGLLLACGSAETATTGEVILPPPVDASVGAAQEASTVDAPVLPKCKVPSDCPGNDTECATRMCNSGICGLALAEQGRKLQAQTKGDCKKKQCNGRSGEETVTDDADVPDDGFECTQDRCTLGQPSYAPKPIDTACGVNLKCDAAGRCVGCTRPSDCGTPANPCLQATCTDGACGVTPKANGATCNDGNACTQTDSCQSGLCVGSNPVVCTAQSQCHKPGICNETTGMCSNPNQDDGTSCNDGNACTQTDSCQGGTCTGTNPVVCTALDQCHNAGTCDTGTGTCSNPNKPNNTPCTDGNACTQTDSCQSGACVGSNPVVCTAQSQCHDVGTCDTGTGTCSNPPNTGRGCNDGNACTQTDTCVAGACVGSNPVVCTALDQCHNAGTCNAGTGACTNPNKPNGTGCNDGNACTLTDTCQGGTCSGANPVVCTALDQCHNVGTCNAGSGVCSNPERTGSCNDGNECTTSDACSSGACGGSPVADWTSCSGGTKMCLSGACSNFVVLYEDSCPKTSEPMSNLTVDVDVTASGSIQRIGAGIGDNNSNSFGLTLEVGSTVVNYGSLTWSARSLGSGCTPGNSMAYATLPTPFAVTSGDTVRITITGTDGTRDFQASKLRLYLLGTP